MSLLLNIILFSALSCILLADEPIPKIISQAIGLKGTPKTQGIILKTDAELSKFLDLPVLDAYTKIKQLLKVNEINFTHHMILVIQGGECKSGGFKVAFEKLEIKGATLQVLWKLQGPPADAFVTQALTYPSVILLVENFKGDITFKQIIDIKK